MSDRALGNVMQQLRGMVAGERPGDGSDAELLGSFLSSRSEAAFAGLMRRHGSMVLGVCQRVLRDRHRAEDAFQATFLVLARKAVSVRKQLSLGSWLYGVAYRVACKMRPRRPLRTEFEMAECEVPDMTRNERDERLWDELVPVIDEEVQRLPDKLRASIVLCYLEGKTYEEAGRQLRLSPDSVRGRLARGRDLLRQRLSRRGLAAPAAALATLLPARAQAAALPPSVFHRTLQAACQVAAGRAAGVSAAVAAAFQGVVKEMFLRKLTIAASLACVFAAVSLTAAGYWQHAAAAQAEPDDPAPLVAVANPLLDQPDEQAAELKRLAHLSDPLHERLAAPVNLDGFEPNTPLKEALGFLADRYGMTILIDTKAFKEDNGQHEADILPIKLPKMTGVSLQTVLRLLLDQVDGTLLVRSDYVLVTTRQRARPQDWARLERRFVPMVTVDLNKKPLEEAARELSNKTGINIVVDQRDAARARAAVSARLHEVPIDTAVNVLADMAGLQAVAVDTVLYITSKDNAKVLQERVDKEEKQRLAAREAKKDKQQTEQWEKDKQENQK